MTPTHHVRARLVGNLALTEFGERFADPLYQALQAQGYGDLTGGEAEQDGEGGVRWISIDLRLIDLDGALEFTRRTLRELGAPVQSELRYDVDGESRVLSVDEAPPV